MDCEQIQVLITAGSTLTGAIIGGWIAAWIAKQQASISLKQSKLNILLAEHAELKELANELSKLKADVSEDQLTIKQVNARLIDLFVKKATTFLSKAYLFPKRIEDEVESCLKQINNMIYSAKNNQPINLDISEALISSLPGLEKKFLQSLRIRLRHVQELINENTIN